ncbi:MAG: 4-hydroxy-3-methylbut-2-enyl diphosphate reductase [Candidatus Omnitrophota bacterium]
MKITIAKSAGFCFGVKRAVKIAIDAAQKGRTVEMLGDIVHNEDVVKQIKKSGMKKITRLTRGENKDILIRAHGTSAEIVEKARSLGYEIIDATCPMVKEIHNIVKDMEDKNFKIIVIGDKNHDEVKGIVGQLKEKATVIDNVKNIPKKVKKFKKACVVVQSTQTEENVFKITAILKEHIKDLKFFNTICRPTRYKQQEIKTMPLENDVMLIIGSKKSANTRRLYEISKTLNTRSYWVQSKKDIKKSWFDDARNIGITAGSSTPDTTTRDIVNYLTLILR